MASRTPRSWRCARAGPSCSSAAPPGAAARATPPCWSFAAAPGRGRPARPRAAAARGAPPRGRGGGRGRRQPLFRGGDRAPDHHVRRQGRRAPARHGPGRDRRAHRPAVRRGEARAPVRGGARPELRTQALTDLLGGPAPEAALSELVRRELLQERSPRAPRSTASATAWCATWPTRRCRARSAATCTSAPRTGSTTRRRPPCRAGRAGGLPPRARRQAAAHAEREARAFDASVTAAEAALRRGATSRAQHLFEQAADHAAAPADALHVLRSAAEIAKQRFRGAEAVKLYRAAGEAAEQAGDADAAAANFARVVETASRFGGLTADAPPLEEQQRLIERARELTPPDAIDARARLLADEAWIHWRGRNHEAMQKAATEAVALARQGDNVFVLSGALDAAMAAEEEAGRVGEGAAFALQRADLLDRLPADTKGSVFERIDIHAMVATTLARVSRFDEALEWHERARELELAHDLDWIAWSRGSHRVLPRPVGHRGERRRQDAGGLEARAAPTRRSSPPRARRSAPSTATAATTPPPPTGSPSPRTSSTTAARATSGSRRCARTSSFTTAAWTRPSPRWRPRRPRATGGARSTGDLGGGSRARRARRRRPAAADRRGLGGRGPHRPGLQPAHARTARGRGGPDREALALFREIGARYQAARTGILLGGEERAAGEAVYAELGVELADAAPA